MASIVLTASAVAWAAGTWWQSRVFGPGYAHEVRNDGGRISDLIAAADDLDAQVKWRIARSQALVGQECPTHGFGVRGFHRVTSAT